MKNPADRNRECLDNIVSVLDDLRSHIVLGKDSLDFLDREKKRREEEKQETSSTVGANKDEKV